MGGHGNLWSKILSGKVIKYPWVSLDPLIRVQQSSIRTSQSIELNFTPVLRNIKLLIL